MLGQDGADYLYGDAGNDILRGGFDNDYLSDRAGAGLLDGGAGNDTLYAGTGIDIIIGGVGNDLYSTGAGNDLILFNQGDGFDILDRGDGGRDILSLGGGLSYSDLRFFKASTDLVLQTGASDQITFRDWYASVPSRSVATLQVIIQPSSGNTSEGSDLTRGHKMESFDFSALVGAFDSARAANASLTSWTLSDALNTCRLAGSDTAAFGGDIAYQYGLLGTVDLVGTAKTFGLLSDPALGSLVRDFTA